LDSVDEVVHSLFFERCMNIVSRCMFNCIVSVSFVVSFVSELHG